MWLQLFFLIIIMVWTEKYSYAREVWIDPHRDLLDNGGRQETPHSMWHKPHELKIEKRALLATTNSDAETSNGSCSRKQFNYSNIFLKRLINLILNSAGMERESHVQFYSGRISLLIDEKDYAFLKKYADNRHEECIISLRNIDAIFSKSVKKNFYEQFTDFSSMLGDHLYYMVFNKLTACCSLILFTAIFVYKLATANSSLWVIIKGFFLMAYIVDFSTTFLHLIEAEEVKRIVNIKEIGVLPPECDPAKMSWLTYLSYLFKNESDCMKYFKATSHNLYYLVTPLKVLNHQFNTVVIASIASLGTALGSFADNVLKGLPWGLNIVLLPILLIFVCMMVMILSASLCECPIKLKIFPFIGFEFGKTHDGKNQKDSLLDNNLKTLLSFHTNCLNDKSDICKCLKEIENALQSVAGVRTSKLSAKKERAKGEKSIKAANIKTIQLVVKCGADTGLSSGTKNKKSMTTPKSIKNFEDRGETSEIIDDDSDDFRDASDNEHVSDKKHNIE